LLLVMASKPKPRPPPPWRCSAKCPNGPGRAPGNSVREWILPLHALCMVTSQGQRTRSWRCSRWTRNDGTEAVVRRLTNLGRMLGSARYRDAVEAGRIKDAIEDFTARSLSQTVTRAIINPAG
jgi:hypothetical protein